MFKVGSRAKYRLMYLKTNYRLDTEYGDGICMEQVFVCSQGVCLCLACISGHMIRGSAFGGRESAFWGGGLSSVESASRQTPPEIRSTDVRYASYFNTFNLKEYLHLSDLIEMLIMKKFFSPGIKLGTIIHHTIYNQIRLSE